MEWIPHPLKFEGERVLLIPLEYEHLEGLAEAAKDERIWTWDRFNGCNREELEERVNEALSLREKGQEYPFTVVDKLNNRIIGMTRFLKLSEEHKSLEIGSTWYNPRYWGMGYNEECKLMLLTYCFETLKTVRVQITANERNMRSRKAILRIGAEFEGVLRNIVIRNGATRSAAYYSILPEEWEEVKANLKQLIGERFLLSSQ